MYVPLTPSSPKKRFVLDNAVSKLIFKVRFLIKPEWYLSLQPRSRCLTINHQNSIEPPPPPPQKFSIVHHCNGNTSSTGKTNDFRLRMNNHISSCRLGTSRDKFGNHVFNCRAKNNYTLEPYFKIYAFMEIADERLLLTYESYLHKKSYGSMN